jgi:hypothetical protein
MENGVAMKCFLPESAPREEGQWGSPLQAPAQSVAQALLPATSAKLVNRREIYKAKCRSTPSLPTRALASLDPLA